MSTVAASVDPVGNATGANSPLPPRMPALDGVRGVAILVVVMHNLSLLTEPSGLGARLLAAWLDRGWIGVQLFFVLSGFLITGILLDSRNAPNYYKSFFGRRALRIFPLYYATLLLMFVVLPALNIWQGLSLAEHPHQLWVTVFLSNWTQPFHVGQGSLPHFWSLAVEEQFYLVWAFVVYRCDAAQVLKWSFVIAVAAFAIRCVLMAAALPPEAIYEFSVCRMDALALGAAGAAALRLPYWREVLLRRQTQLMWACVAVLMTGAAVSHTYLETARWNQIFGFSFLAVGFGLFVLIAACADIRGADGGWLAWLRSDTLRRFGLYSYAMYVLHVPLREVLVLPLLRRFGLENHSSLAITSMCIAVGTAVSYVLAMASYHFFEIHFLRLKRYFMPAVPASSRSG